MTSRKHYEAVAAMLAERYSDVTEQGQKCRLTIEQEAAANEQLDKLIVDLARYFKADNPRFDHLRFIEACTAEDGTELAQAVVRTSA